MRLWPLLRQHNLVSSEWLQNHQRRESRVQFDGVTIKWPINKVVNEHPKFQTYKLRTRA